MISEMVHQDGRVQSQGMISGMVHQEGMAPEATSNQKMTQGMVQPQGRVHYSHVHPQNQVVLSGNRTQVSGQQMLSQSNNAMPLCVNYNSEGQWSTILEWML